jgi:hypothetical protein
MRRYVFRLAMVSLTVLSVGTARGDDQQIAQQIVQRLQAEKQAGTLKGFSIDLQVDEGTVWLSGRVANEQQQARALDIARRVPGVQQVVNDLTIAPPPSKTASQSAAAHEGAVPQSEMLAKPVAPTKNPFFESMTRTLGNVTAAGRNEKTQHSTSVEARSMASQPTAATSQPPVGSGVDATVASTRRSVVQAAPPVANVPSPAPAASQPLAVPQPLANSQVAAIPQPVAQPPAQPAVAQGMMMPAAPAVPSGYVAVPVPAAYAVPVYAGSTNQVPLAMGPARTVTYVTQNEAAPAPMPMYLPGSGVGIAPARYDHPTMPGYAWPSYAAYPNYAAVTYPKQYSPTAWPYIGPFYPYPQVPLGWRKVTLEWDDGWWMLDFKDRRSMYNH